MNSRQLLLAGVVLSACEPVVYQPTANGDDNGGRLPPGTGVCVDVNGVRPATAGCADGAPCAVADFGAVLPTRSHTKAIIVTNCDSATLTIRGLFWAPASSSAFELLEPRRDRPADPLPQGASLTLRVRYQPDDQDGDHAMLVLLTDRSEQSRLVIGLRGNTTCSRALACTPGPVLTAGEVGGATCTALGSEPVAIANVSLAGDPVLSLEGGTSATLPPGESLRVRFACGAATGVHTGNATVFSDACADSLDLAVRCDAPPPPAACSAGPYTGSELWRWSELSPGSTVDDVITMPRLARLDDSNHNGVPDAGDSPSVVFTAFAAGTTLDLCQANNPAPGVLVVTDAAGTTRWTFGQLPPSPADPVATVQANSQLAIADIDGDSWPEILALRFRFRGPPPGCAPTDLFCCLQGKYTTGTLLLLERDGALAWESEPWHLSDFALQNAGAPAVADTNGDGFLEVAFGNTLFDRFGHVLAHSDLGEGDAGGGPFAVFCDLDLDGTPELVAGNTLFAADGSVVWQRDDLADGVVTCADTHDDARLEIVLFTSSRRLLVLDRNGDTRAGPVRIDNSEGDSFTPRTPAVGDVDGDGIPEITVSAGDLLFLFEHTLAEVWRRPQSAPAPSGVSLFDVDGDGPAEILDPDDGGVEVLNGAQVALMSVSGGSSSTPAAPLVVDLDHDGYAEVLLTEDDPLGFTNHHGVVAVQPTPPWCF